VSKFPKRKSNTLIRSTHRKYFASIEGMRSDSKKAFAFFDICLILGAHLIEAERIMAETEDADQDADLEAKIETRANLFTGMDAEAKSTMSRLVKAFHEDTQMQEVLNSASRGNVSRADSKWFSWFSSSCEAKEAYYKKTLPKVRALMEKGPDELGFLGQAKLTLKSRSLMQNIMSAKKKACAWVQKEEVKDTLEDLFDDATVDEECDNVAASTMMDAAGKSQEEQEQAFLMEASAMLDDKCATTRVIEAEVTDYDNALTLRQLVDDSDRVEAELASSVGDPEVDQLVEEAKMEDAPTGDDPDHGVQSGTLDDTEWGFGTLFTEEDQQQDSALEDPDDGIQWGFGEDGEEDYNPEEWGFGEDAPSLVSVNADQAVKRFQHQSSSLELEVQARGIPLGAIAKGLKGVGKVIFKVLKFLIKVILWAVFCLVGVTTFTLILGIILCTVKAVIISLINLFKSKPLAVGLFPCLKKFARAFSKGQTCCAGLLLRRGGAKKCKKGGRGGGARGGGARGGGSPRGGKKAGGSRGGKKQSKAAQKKANHLKKKMKRKQSKIESELRKYNVDWAAMLELMSHLDMDTLRQIQESINNPEELAEIVRGLL